MRPPLTQHNLTDRDLMEPEFLSEFGLLDGSGRVSGANLSYLILRQFVGGGLLAASCLALRGCEGHHVALGSGKKVVGIGAKRGAAGRSDLLPPRDSADMEFIGNPLGRSIRPASVLLKRLDHGLSVRRHAAPSPTARPLDDPRLVFIRDRQMRPGRSRLALSSASARTELTAPVTQAALLNTKRRAAHGARTNIGGLHDEALMFLSMAVSAQQRKPLRMGSHLFMRQAARGVPLVLLGPVNVMKVKRSMRTVVSASLALATELVDQHRLSLASVWERGIHKTPALHNVVTVNTYSIAQVA